MPRLQFTNIALELKEKILSIYNFDNFNMLYSDPIIFDKKNINYKINENGYIRVYIYNKTYMLHRLIAFAFLENQENKEEIIRLKRICEI